MPLSVIHRRTLGAAVVALLLTACETVPAGADPGAAPVAPAVPGALAVGTGRLQVVQWPVVTIDGRPMRAAPGARILGVNNLMLTPNLVPGDARVQYELDGSGQLRLIRLLDARAGEPVGVPRAPSSGAR